MKHLNNNVIITLVNKNTREKQELKSIYYCAKAIGEKPGSIPYCIKKIMVRLKVVIIENVLVKNYILLKYFKNLFS